MGFYYDDQLMNDHNTIRLYSNKELDSSNITSSTQPHQFKDTSNGKYSNLLARAIMSEDFQVEIGNNWSQFEGANIIEGGFNALKPLGGLINTITSSDEVNNSLKEMVDSMNDKGSSWIETGLNKMGGYLAKGVNAVKNGGYLDKALVAQGAKLVYFSGTDVALGNLSMRYTIFYDPVENLTVHDQIDKILPFCIGRYRPMTDDINSIKKSAGVESGSTASNILDGIGQYLGWQDPPGGFESMLGQVDKNLKGTLKLEFGTKYAITNLLLKNMSINYSRHSVKIKPSSSEGNVLKIRPTPLYADVTLTFQPAGPLTDAAISRFVKGLELDNISIKD